MVSDGGEIQTAYRDFQEAVNRLVNVCVQGHPVSRLVHSRPLSFGPRASLVLCNLTLRCGVGTVALYR